MRSLLFLTAAVLYLAALGAPRVRQASVTHDLTVSLIASDTDLDDDVLGSPCLHSNSFDDGFQNFDCAATPHLSFRPQVARVLGTEPSAPFRLDEGGLFRPPRVSPLV